MLCCSVTKLCPTLCNPMDGSMPSSSVLCYLLELAQIHVHWVRNACYLAISSSVTPFSFCLQSFPAAESFPVSWLCASGDQSVGASALASVLPMNIQGWFPLGFTGLISLLSKGLLRSWELFNFNLSVFKFLAFALLFRIFLIPRFSQWGTISCQSEWLLFKSLQAINAGEVVEKREPYYTLVGMQTSISTMDNWK